MKKGMMTMKGGGGMMMKGGTPAPTSGPTSSAPTSAPTPSMTIAEFIISKPDLSIIFFALQRLNEEDLELSQEDLEFIFNGDVPFTGYGGRKLKFVQNNPLRRNNLVEILDEPGDFTFFAPTNDAFKAIGQDLLATLFLRDEFRPHLEDLVLYHGFLGERFTDDFVNNERVLAFNSENVTVRTNPVRINANTLALPNNAASNGVTHVIRGVLQPDWVANSNVNFVDSMSDLSILSELLVLADLDGLTILGNTLAAPKNSAFEALGQATLNSLRLPANRDALERILSYHFILNILTSDRLAQQTFSTFAGINIETSVVGQTIKLNQATVIGGPDILLTNNGALYKIDAVLNPDDPANGF